MKNPDLNKIAEHYAAILTELGADLNSEGMRETPTRAENSEACNAYAGQDRPFPWRVSSIGARL